MTVKRNHDNQRRQLFLRLFRMSAKRVYSPPLLEDGDNTDKWLREIELWKYLTELDITEQKPVIYFIFII